MKGLVKFLDIVDNINEWIGKTITLLLIGLMLLVVYEVVLRYFFARPTIWDFEVCETLLLATVCLGGGYTLLHRGHIIIDVLYGRWSIKTRAKLDLVTYLLLFVLCIVLIRYGGVIAWEALIKGRPSNTAWAPPIWPTLMMVPVGGALLGLQCLAKWVRDWVMVVKGIKLQSKVVSGEGGLRG